MLSLSDGLEKEGRPGEQARLFAAFPTLIREVPTALVGTFLLGGFSALGWNGAVLGVGGLILFGLSLTIDRNFARSKELSGE